jgi:ATP-binding cassette subfamily B protein
MHVKHQQNKKGAGFRGILPYLSRRKGLFVIAFALMLVVSASGLAGPLIIKEIVDEAIPRGDSGLMLLMAFAYVGSVAAMGIASYFETLTVARLGLHAVTELKRDLFGAMLRLPVAWFDQHPTGELMARVEGDCERVREFFGGVFINILTNLLFVLGIVAVFLTLHVEGGLGYFLLAPLPLFVALAFFFGRLTRLYDAIRERYAAIVAKITEFLQAHEVLRAFARESWAARKVEAASREKRDRDVRASMLEYSVMGLFQFLTGPVLIAAMVWFAFPGVFAGSLTVGALLLSIEYARRMIEPIVAIADNVRSIQQARAALGRIFAIMALEPERDSAARPLEGFPGEGRTREARFEREIRFENVSFAYKEGETVLDGIDFRIAKGKTVALVGASGSGKSTTIGLLARFHAPRSGRILVDGIDIEDIPLALWRRKLGLVLQDVYLFPGSLLENVRVYDDSIPRAKVEESLEAVGAVGLLSRLPGGLDGGLGERGGKLSQGERQLVAFARAMAFDAELIILDEATASVDMATERLIHESMARLRAGRTALVVAHRLSSIEEADEILYFDAGRIAARGSHKELLAAHPAYAELVRLQTGEGR